MKIKLTRFIAFILCLPLALGLIACNKGDESGSTTTTLNDGGETPTPTDASTTTTAKPNEPIEPSEPEKGPLDGKRVIFIGNSYVYYGQSVISMSKSELTQSARENDKGYFYQLCKAYGSEVNVTNWTIGSHGLSDFFGGTCTISGSCYGVKHEEYLTNRYYDYVFVSPSGGTKTAQNLEADFDYIINFFKEANPNVKIVCLGNLGAHGYSSWGIDLPEVYTYYKTLEEKGVIIADWGGIVNGIIDGDYKVEGASESYNAKSFIIKDGYHPNQLSGYITTLTAYCAITGESAVGRTYDFCNNSSLHTKFNFNTYISNHYNNASDTNYPAVFASASDMQGIQKLIDWYLAEKPYLEYEMPDDALTGGPLDGKKVIFIGNSYLYYGHSIISKSENILEQASRENDQGYFYQICKKYGSNVSVTNWTFASHGLSDLFGGTCGRSKHSGINHENYLTDRYYDYVFVAPSGGAQKQADNIAKDFENIINFFTAANPNVKIVCLGNLGAHGYSSTGIELPGIYNYYKTLEDMGVIIADFGGLISGIIDGTYTVPGATQTYNKNSFIIAKDGFNPNQLTGYITTLMTYCAITGESAVGKTYDFCNDKSLNTKFDFADYVLKYYTAYSATTNYPDVFASAEDMKGIQELIDWYMTNKPYRN